ncbi:hypothetical protein CDCA_CDCA13G3634 [Cyanidium caldarium]|uniref:40S ribosomal protein S15 n=1 Tax=Cyanidium caldarium TaxID=2771 RepID=A0AAV9IZ74_CYACA|nr:hypothetical protein CDCA_CDCA13G3634 [Cyanidium caldarium]
METASTSAAPRKRTFRKFSYRGIDLEALLALPQNEMVELLPSRARRRIRRGFRKREVGLVKRIRKAKAAVPDEFTKPAVIKTHCRNLLILPEMVGARLGVYNGKTFNEVEIRGDMIGHYLGEFSITYRPVKHGRPGIGASSSSRFIPLK